MAKSFTYHYVHRKSEGFGYPHIHSFDLFMDQIFKMKNIYSFITPDTLFDKSVDISNSILLTFDDGLKDHLRVGKFLHDLNIRATFFIPTSPYTSGQMLNVHKAHYLLAKLGSSCIIHLMTNLHNVSSDFYDDHYLQLQEKHKNRYEEYDETIAIKDFKRYINYILNQKTSTIILDSIAKHTAVEFPEDSFYLTPKEIRDLEMMGHEIGAHSSSHDVLSRLSTSSQEKEIYESKRFLNKLLGKSVKTFCFPYGNRDSYNPITISILKRLGFKSSFTVEPRDISSFDITKCPFELPRYDANSISKFLDE